MQLTLDTKSLREALDIIGRLTSADHANLFHVKQDIYLSAIGNNKSVKLLVKGTVDALGKEGGFGFNTFTVSNLIKGRQQIQLTLKNNSVHFANSAKGSKFYGDFQPIPFEDISITTDANASKVVIKGSSMTALGEAVNTVRLNNLYTQDPLNLFLRIDKTGLHTVVYDDYHIAYCHNASVNEKDAAEFSMALPLFDTISNVARGEDYNINIGQTYVTAFGLGFELSLPILQGLEGQTFDQARQFIEGLAAQKTSHSLTIEVDDIKQTIDSLIAVDDGQSPIIISSERGKAKFSISSGFGHANERKKIDLTGWTKEFKLNPKLFTDTISVFPSKEVKLNFHDVMVTMVDEIGASRVVYSCLLM